MLLSRLAQCTLYNLKLFKQEISKKFQDLLKNEALDKDCYNGILVYLLGSKSISAEETISYLKNKSAGYPIALPEIITPRMRTTLVQNFSPQFYVEMDHRWILEGMISSNVP